MPFLMRPLFAVAALALATPAFAQVGTTAPTVTAPAAQPAAKTDVKTPDAAVKTDTAVKADTTAKADTTVNSDAAVKADAKVKPDTKTTTGAMEKKEKSSKVEAKTKVSANTHHHGKVTKKA